MLQHANWKKQSKGEAVYAREGLRCSVGVELCGRLGSTNSSWTWWSCFLWKEKAECQMAVKQKS